MEGWQDRLSRDSIGGFSIQILVCLGMSVFGSMIWDRLCVAVFAPKLLWVGYVDAWQALPPWRVAAYELSKYGESCSVEASGSVPSKAAWRRASVVSGARLC